MAHQAVTALTGGPFRSGSEHRRTAQRNSTCQSVDALARHALIPRFLPPLKRRASRELEDTDTLLTARRGAQESATLRQSLIINAHVSPKDPVENDEISFDGI